MILLSLVVLIGLIGLIAACPGLLVLEAVAIPILVAVGGIVVIKKVIHFFKNLKL